MAAVAGTLSILWWRIFPVCFRDGSGLTPFKVSAEYVIIVVSLIAMVLLYRDRESLHAQVRHSLLGALGMAALAELAFTLYTDVYGISNTVGHLLRLVSRFLVFHAFIESGLNRPLAFFFRRLREDNALLLESEERWRILTESSPDHILDVDTELNIRFVNYTAPGLSQSDLIGRNLLDFLPHDQKDGIRQILEGVLARGGSGQYENRYDLPDGGYIQYETTAMVRKDADDRPTGLTLVARDITERHFRLMAAQARLRVSEFAIGRNLDEMLVKVLDEAEKLSSSRLGFFHFVASDGESLLATTWSSGSRSLLGEQTGQLRARRQQIWQSCAHRGEPHIHNSLPSEHPEWMDNDDPHIVREMVLPIRHDQKLVAVLGRGQQTRALPCAGSGSSAGIRGPDLAPDRRQTTGNPAPDCRGIPGPNPGPPSGHGLPV